MDDKKEPLGESPNIEVVKHHKDSLPSWDELKYFARKYYLLLLVVALIPVGLFSLGQQLANSSSAAPLLKLNSGAKIKPQILTAQNVVINEGTCFGICTSWDETRVAQCGPYGVSRFGCGILQSGCAWTGGNDQCYLGSDLKVHYCGQLCPDPTIPIDAIPDKIYCKNNQIINHYANGDTNVEEDCGSYGQVCVPGLNDYGPNTAGCRESCTTAEACCKYAIGGIPDDIAAKCEFDKPICFNSQLTNIVFTEKVTCRKVEEGAYCDNDGEQICESNQCNADNSGCAASSILQPTIDSSPPLITNSPIPNTTVPTSVSQITASPSPNPPQTCNSDNPTASCCKGETYYHYSTKAGCGNLICFPTSGGNCMAVYPTQPPTNPPAANPPAQPTFAQGGVKICNPGEWGSCHSNGCGGRQLSNCDQSGTKWNCIDAFAQC